MGGRFSQFPIHLQASIIQALHKAGQQPHVLDEDLAETRPRYILAPSQRAGVIVDSPGVAARRR